MTFLMRIWTIVTSLINISLHIIIEKTIRLQLLDNNRVQFVVWKLFSFFIRVKFAFYLISVVSLELHSILEPLVKIATLLHRCFFMTNHKGLALLNFSVAFFFRIQILYLLHCLSKIFPKGIIPIFAQILNNKL